MRYLYVKRSIGSTPTRALLCDAVLYEVADMKGRKAKGRLLRVASRAA